MLSRLLASTGMLILSALPLAACSNADAQLHDQWKHARFSGFSKFRNNKYSESVDHYKTAVSIARRFPRGGAVDLAITLNDLGRAQIADKDLVGACTSFKEASDLVRDAKDSRDANESRDAGAKNSRRVQTESYSGLADALTRLNKPDEAAKYRQLALAATAVEPIPQTQSIAEAAVEAGLAAGQAALTNKDLASAKKQWKQAFVDSMKLSNKIYAARASERMGALALQQDRLIDAHTWFSRALQYCKDANTPLADRRATMAGMTQTLTKLHSYVQAEKCAAELVRLSEQLNTTDERELREAWNMLADVYDAQGKNALALAQRQKCFENSKKHEVLSSADNALNCCHVAHSQWTIGKASEARTTVSTYLASLAKLPAPQSLFAVRLMNDFAEVCAKSGAHDEAAMFGREVQRVLNPLTKSRNAEYEKQMSRARSLQATLNGSRAGSD